MTHATIVSNTSSLNLLNSGVLTLLNTILANHPTSDCQNTGTISGDSANYLIETDDPTNACGGASLSVDPQLLPLADNGGQTNTHLPSGSSPVLKRHER